MSKESLDEAMREFEKACDEHIARYGRNAKVYLSGAMSHVPRKIAEKIPSVTFPSGGFVPPYDAPKVGVAQMQGGETVLPKTDILKKFGTSKVEPIDLGRIDIASKKCFI